MVRIIARESRILSSKILPILNLINSGFKTSIGCNINVLQALGQEQITSMLYQNDNVPIEQNRNVPT